VLVPNVVNHLLTSCMIGQGIVKNVPDAMQREIMNTIGQRIVKNVLNVVQREIMNTIGQRIVKNVPNVA